VAFFASVKASSGCLFLIVWVNNTIYPNTIFRNNKLLSIKVI
jgi:hypothetical protein